LIPFPRASFSHQTGNEFEKLSGIRNIIRAGGLFIHVSIVEYAAEAPGFNIFLSRR